MLYWLEARKEDKLVMNSSIKNIPLAIRSLIIILGAFSFLYSSNPITSDKTFLFCLKSNQDLLEINRFEEGFSVDNEELNSFFVRNKIVNIERWLPYANENDYDGDIYLNRIYRVYVDEHRSADISKNILELSSYSFIKYAENEFIRTPKYSPNDPLVTTQCSLNSVKATSAWDFWDIPNNIIPDGREVLLASVDTGVDYTHPDLQNNSWINQAEIPEWMSEAGLDSNGDGYIEAAEVVEFLENENMDINNDGEYSLRDAVSDGSPFEDDIDNDGNGYTDDLIGWDNSGYYGPDDNDPFPKEDVANNSTWAHGTHVAGILAATTDNDLGMASTAYNAKFISVKVSRENQSGEPGISDGYSGILYAAKAGYYAGTFTIINNSWGGGGYSASENSTINTAYNTYGAIITCAAGNGDEGSGSQEYGSHYPSSYENSTSVCAMGCSYSWGNWATYHYTVDLAAPGESINSAIIGQSFESWDGSSMASPNAASCFGLLKAYYPNWTNQQLRDRMYATADRKVYEDNPEYETCNGNSGDDCFGYGMVDVYKAIGVDFSPSISIDTSYVLTVNDDDGVLNPGENGELVISLSNQEGWVNANALIANLSTDNEYIQLSNDVISYGQLPSGQSVTPQENFEFSVSTDIELGEVEFILDVVAVGLNGYQYTASYNVDIDVSLFQSGFPFDTNSEIKSASAVVDLDNDNINEIILADYSGQVRIIKEGIELDNEHFPYDTGNQIWGAVSSADLDLDGLIDFVVASKSKYIYIFDINGLKASYYADRYLIGTPVIGNIDTDEYLEIVVGGYSGSTSSNPIYAINYDGSEVDGFPYVLGEKIKAGVAIVDMDGNGIGDIIFGTDGEEINVLLDNLTIAPNFPVNLDDFHNGAGSRQVQSEPAVYDTGSEKIILAGSKDNNFYAINYSDASLRFMIPTDDDIFTSPSFDASGNIYFGSDDGFVYAVDIDGNMIDGFPLEIGSSIVGSIVFSDLDGNGEEDMVVGTAIGELYAYNDNFELFDYFPIDYQFPYSSSPQIIDYDQDGDLEILAGTSGDLVVVDMKYQAEIDEVDPSWSLFKGDLLRTGFYYNSDSSGGCTILGDVNCDLIIDIIDIIIVVNMIMDGLEEFSASELWAADINDDAIIDILDVLIIVNIVLDNN